MADAPRSPLLAVTALPGAAGELPLAAALGVAVAGRGAGWDGVVVCEPGGRARRPTLLSSVPARTLESRLRKDMRAVARGALCWVCLGDEPMAAVDRCREEGAAAVVVCLGPAAWSSLMADPGQNVRAAAIRADLPAGRELAGLAAIEARRRQVSLGVVTAAPGVVAARRALAGLEPGGWLGTRSARMVRRFLGRAGEEGGQALPLVLGLALATVVAGLALALLGAAATGGARMSRAVDLAAVSAARSMRDDHRRLFVRARTPAGRRNPHHLSRAEYRRRARDAARHALRANGTAGVARITFPGRPEVPVRVRVVLVARPRVGDSPAGSGTVRAVAAAEAFVPSGAGPGQAPTASGGGYAGPLAYRQGKPMRPDVAAAFDRLAAAARRAGHALVVNSAFRSDAEQAALFAANPDPTWVAPPGRSLHRCATELDLGPPGAHSWLASHAGRFGFVRRYSWEPWHFGYERGPAPCSAVATDAGSDAADGAGSGGSLPTFVPARFRRPLARAASRWNVAAGLLAAQLEAESGFEPLAVSPAGARGIAQFMPGTAAAYGLRDPFDPEAAIDAQAHLMSDLLRQFGDVSLALAAYNAGPAPVSACRCVPPYPETQAYVARILGLMAGAGEIAPPALEVRLVR